MMSSIKESEDSICLWCGIQTNSENSSHEHLFPASIGGKKRLPMGSICKECNQKLSFLNRALMREHPAMMDAFQADPNIIGYKRKGKYKDEKVRRRIYFEGEGEAKRTRIDREDFPNVNLVNANFIVTSERFVRALHKCTSNILCYNFGSTTTRENYGALLSFVYNGGDVRPWSYAVSFSNPFQRPLISEPKSFIVSINGNNIAGFLHTSGIWLTGSRPYSFNPRIIEIVSERIVEKIVQDNETNSERAIGSFGFNYDLSKDRILFGKLKFLWVVKE